MNKFSDKGKYNFEFTDEIAVECPKCSQLALIKDRDRLSCQSCSLTIKKDEGKWFGSTIGYVRRRCYECGRRLHEEIKGPKHKYEFKLICSGCKCEMIEPIKWEQSHEDKTHDIYFGLPLWFTGTVKGNEFWLFNREHLNFLKNYISAKIRVREPNKNSSMVSRLPSWLLSKKNRDAVLKEINRIENR